MHIFIALLIYIGIVSASNISSYWDKDRLTIHKPMEFMTFFCFEQIKQYLYVSSPITTQWYMKLEPLASQLRTKFTRILALSYIRSHAG
jgi:hypothetical protein